MSRWLSLMLAAILCLLSVTLMAEPISKADYDDFVIKLKKHFPKAQPDSISQGPVEGLYEVVMGPKVFYMSKDARYLVLANIIDLEQGKNLTKPRTFDAVRAALATIGEENMITFSPEKPRFTVTAFTDIDCGYCRKMHSQMDAYNKLGIAIRYLFFPAAGIGSDSYKKAVAVWCSEDRKAAMTRAKAGKDIGQKTCDNPVMRHLQLVKQLGLRGTPGLVLPSGEVIESYIPPAELLKILVRQQQK